MVCSAVALADQLAPSSMASGACSTDQRSCTLLSELTTYTNSHSIDTDSGAPLTLYTLEHVWQDTMSREIKSSPKAETVFLQSLRESKICLRAAALAVVIVSTIINSEAQWEITARA